MIKMDPTLVLRLLKLVNSAYFSLRTKINNISEAVAYIGVDNLRNMIILDAIKNLFKDDSGKNIFSKNRLWLHCSVTSICSQMIAERIFVTRGEDAFLCGILHDIGIIVEAQVAPEKFETFCKNFVPETQDMTTQEKQILGTDHTVLGGMLTAEWKLPQELCYGITAHHSQLKTVTPESHAGTLQIAEYLIARLEYNAFPDVISGMSPPLLSHIKDNIMGYRAIVDDLPHEIQKARAIYDLEED